MCGIAGIYGFRDDNLIKKFSEQLSHRGPDGEGYFINDQISLLNRRLAIIDRKGGDQPIFNEDRSVVVTYNGEIYNYQELRKTLESNGHVFKTQSDTEVIVHGYEEWGEMCFDKFNGMFGIALYDIRKKKLVLARDHFGIKPLYYSVINSKLKTQNSKLQLKIQNFENLKLIFSSEIRPIIHSGMIRRIPNDRIIYRYLRYRIHDDQRETFFAGIYRLLPGEMMIVHNDHLQISKYTNLEEELKTSVDARHDGSLQQEDIETFKKKLTAAIRLRLISEVPVGTCLSGGLDSSTVVAVVNKLISAKVKEAMSVGKIQNTFSAVFPGANNDEEKYIDNLKSQISNLKSHKIYPKPEEFFKEIEEFIRTQEEPTISTGPYAQYKVMQEAHKHVTVLLDGQGADEMMAGYIPYHFVYLRQLWKGKKLKKFLVELFKARDFIYVQLINRLYKSLKIKKEIEIRKLLNDKWIGKFSKESFLPVNDNLKKRLIKDIFSNSLQALLRYEDRNSMRFSIEGRVPFLDINFLKYLFSLNDEAIIKNGWNKYILRESVRNIVPDVIRLRRNKIGFTTPEHQWFIRMKNKIYSIFLSDSFAKRKYFNQQEVLGAFQKFIEGKNDGSMVFWRLLNLELWLREFIDVKKDVGTVRRPVRIRKEFDYQPNEGKKLEIKVEGKMYLRFPIRTELFEKGDDLCRKITDSVTKFLSQVNSSSTEVSSSNIHFRKNLVTSSIKNQKFFIVISEKIVAIAQGRSYFIWDIKPSFLAKALSNFVTKTPYGIGLGSPWTMELALREVGVVRVMCAAAVAALTKPLGLKGLFYRIAGKEVASIDGPTEYSLYPSNVSAKLGPKNPSKVAAEIHSWINSKLNPPAGGQKSKPKLKSQKQKTANYELQTPNFLGVVIIDANDLGQKVLGNSTNLPSELIEKIFSDNPMGQTDEQTPLVLVFTE